MNLSSRVRRVWSSVCISAVDRMAAPLTIGKGVSVTMAGIVPAVMVRFFGSYRLASHF